MREREDEAMDVLECLNEKTRDDPEMKQEFAAVKQTVLEMSKGSFRSLFEMSEYREFHRVVLGYVNQVFQQISGINLITYYVCGIGACAPRLSLMQFSRLHNFTRTLASLAATSQS